MVPAQLIRRYARNQQVYLRAADQEIVLHYALALLNQVDLVGVGTDGRRGLLLFKGGTALRKCLFAILALRLLRRSRESRVSARAFETGPARTLRTCGGR
jgi:predicted nucleotidyltransferase component of viral defense system